MSAKPIPAFIQAYIATRNKIISELFYNGGEIID